MLNRRTFLGNTLKLSAGMALGCGSTCSAEGIPLLTLNLADRAPVNISADFIGLGFEMSSVASPNLLRVTNHPYVELVKGLGPGGVLRVGGIVANYTRYEPMGIAKSERQDTVINRAILMGFADFLKEVGWTAIWSVNFAQGTIQDAVEEARAVAEVLGSRLLAIEVGNEVDSYGKGQPFRLSSYDYADYREEYSKWHAAIEKAVPGIRFAAPDTTTKAVDWTERMAEDASGDVQLLTTHYYRNGQRRGTAEQLLLPDPRLKDILVGMRTASQKSGIPWRMCEANSFSGGGRPGVSDTFVDALWTLDFLLLLAEYGCSGVNIETGVNQLGFISSYSPIQDNGKGVNTAGVPYYGMLAFATAMAEGHHLLPIDMDSHGINLTAYAIGVGKKARCVVIVNKDSTRDASVSTAGLDMHKVEALRLVSSSPESKTGVTFGGAPVNAEGQWKAIRERPFRDEQVAVPRMSAVVLRSIE